MATEVWKYPVSPGPFAYPMPEDAQVLTVGTQATQAVLWALVTPTARKRPRSFVAVATGEPLPADTAWTFRGTFFPEPGLVFHLFEATRQSKDVA